MLKNLLIQNYAIIEDLNMSFGKHLNIITGETGAGKSILTGALGLIQGNRADTKVLYDESKKCIVEAEFDNESPIIKNLFAAEGIDFESPIIIRRVIAPNGKSRAFINDEPVNLGFLKELSGLLVDMHRQFDTLGINDETTQISMLDSLSDNTSNLEQYRLSFSVYRKKKNELQRLIAEEASVNQEIDFLQFQLDELDEANFLEASEQEELENEVNLLENADSIITILQKINFLFEESEVSIIDQLSELRNDLDKLGDLGKDTQSLLDRLNSVAEELRDISYYSSSLSGNIESDPKLLEEKRERLSLLYRLLQKHTKEDLSELIAYHEEVATKMIQLRSYSKDKTKLEKDLENLQADLDKMAETISQKRQKAAPELEKAIVQLLADLGMNHAQFLVKFQDSKELRIHGKDEIQFLFSANPGKTPQALNEVASGGELSRLALSLKSTVAGKIELGTLIFDEIDTGISGDVAGKMGLILKKLANEHQLISITHSPQIASRADTHFFIYKIVENNRTYTKVKELNQAERILEIAKMLSGDPPSDSAIKNAKELIEN